MQRLLRDGSVGWRVGAGEFDGFDAVVAKPRREMERRRRLALLGVQGRQREGVGGDEAARVENLVEKGQLCKQCSSKRRQRGKPRRAEGIAPIAILRPFGGSIILLDIYRTNIYNLLQTVFQLEPIWFGKPWQSDLFL